MTVDQLLLIVLFLLGSSIGSFVNVLVDRHDRLKSVFFESSQCPKCKKRIRWYDLVPVFSYLALRGKCRDCGVKIPVRIPIVEVTVGILFVLTWSVSSFSAFLPALLFFSILSTLMALFFVDLEHGILPDYLLIILFALGILFHINIGLVGLGVQLGVGLVYFAFFLILFLLTRGRGMGFGDVKFAFVIGVLLGFPDGAMALYISFVLGAIVSVTLVLLGKKKLRGDTVPFGPFLVSGTLIMLLFSEQVYLALVSLFLHI